MRVPGAELCLGVALALGCGRGRAHRDDAALVVAPPPSPAITPAVGISATSPDLGPAGQWVYVYGWGFKAGATIEVGGASTVAHVCDDQLGFAIPASSTGTTRIVVHVDTLEATSPHDYTVGVPHERTRITDFDPVVRPGGTYVTVNGAGFVFGATTVRFGDHAIPAYVFGPSQLTFTVPQTARHDEQVIVESPNGTAHSDGQFHVR